MRYKSYFFDGFETGVGSLFFFVGLFHGVDFLDSVLCLFLLEFESVVAALLSIL
jgi:hypothetical protein